MFSTASTILAKDKLLLLTLLRSISGSVLDARIKTFCCLYCVYDGRAPQYDGTLEFELLTSRDIECHVM